MKFLSIDLGWQSGASGLCCLNWQDGALTLLDLQRQTAIAEILAWVDRWTGATDPAVIAVDAPTLIPNETGMRLPDRLAHQYFGRYDAGCYPANRCRPFAQRLLEFGQALETREFKHAPHSSAQSPGRFQLEVFPHPVTIHLFQLSRILKYKKGRLADRRAELMRLRTYQLEVLPTLAPPLALTEADLPAIPPAGGTALKAVEDQLDSLLCAYAAAHWWVWGLERNWVLGDVAAGYIVVPAPFQGPMPTLPSKG